MLAGTIVRARLYDRALSAEEVAVSAGTSVSEAEIVARLSPAERKARSSLLTDLANLQADVRRLEARLARKVYTNVPTH